MVQIARMLRDEMATPVTAIVCDGVPYDVATLEEIWGWSMLGGDFHLRAFSARSAGLELLAQRLQQGDRPTEARLWPVDTLPLPPTDCDRAVYLQARIVEGEPTFERRDARALVGDGQPVPLPHAPPRPQVRPTLAVFVCEDLSRATAAQARRAIHGATLLLDWQCGDGREAPSQLGPVLDDSLHGRLGDAVLELQIDAERVSLPAPAGPRVDELVALASHRAELRAGDVVGLLPYAEVAVPQHTSVTLTLPRCMRLSGHAAEAPPLPSWRR